MNKYLYIFLVLIIACAQIRSPTGGEIDETPPLIEEMVPGNFSTNFQGEQILISFNEYVKLENFYEQLLVSPPLNERPEVVLKGKNLILKLNQELQANTTYTFNFGEGVVDNNEGNVLDSNKVVFSTGPVLDSLTLSGIVIDAFSNESTACSVLLHPIGKDSSLVNNNPSYFAKSNEQGKFLFENLREGTYQLFALDDIDRNYKWTENEKMAFLNEDIYVVQNDSLTHQLKLFQKEPAKLSIKNSKARNTGQVEIVFNKDIDSLFFKSIGFSYSEMYIDQAVKDSISLFYEDVIPKENCALEIFNLSQLVDTISLFPFESSKKKEYPELNLKQSLVVEQDPNNALILETNNPIKRIDPDKFLLRIDTIVQETKPFLKKFNRIELNGNWSVSNSGSLVIYPGAIQDIYKQNNDTLILRLKILDESDFGEFNITLNPPRKAKYIFEVYNDSEVLKRENVDSLITFNWPWFQPGEIKMRLIEDLNFNGKWDSGDYLKKIQAERVWVFGEKIQVRPNWTLDQEWIIKE